jgi:ABC-2 type transport system ATP-binding protein
MKQRLGLILSLLGDKPLIIWDEPMSGLDPLGRKCVADTMITLKQRGKTILFTTHVLTDVDQIADHFLLIFDGRLIDQGVMDGSFTMSERFHNAIVQPSQTRNII